MAAGGEGGGVVGEGNASFMSFWEIREKNKISCSLIANLVCVYSITVRILNVSELSISYFKQLNVK